MELDQKLELAQSWLFIWSLHSAQLQSGEVKWLPEGLPDKYIDFVYPTNPYTTLTWRNLWKINMAPSGFWGDKISTIFRTVETVASGYAERLYVVELKTQFANKNAFEEKYTEKIDDLVGQLKKGEQSKSELQVSKSSFFTRHSSLLYYELTASVLTQTDQAYLKSIALNLMEKVGITTKSVSQPFLLYETLVLPGIGSGQMYEELTAVNAGERRRDDSKLVVSVVVNDLLTFLCGCRKLGAANFVLEANAFANQSVESYLGKLTSTTSLKPRWEAEVYGYTDVFLKDRRASLAQRLSACHAVSDIDGQMQNNYVLATEKNQSAITVELPATPSTKILRYGLAEHLREKYNLLVTNARATADAIAQMDALLSDFLRDKTTAEATSANLKLQERLESLTWVMFVAALVALVIGVLPESAKDTIWSSVQELWRIPVLIFQFLKSCWR
jgi:hypothetical protein